MFTGMPYVLRGKKEIEVIKASTEVAGFVRACCLCSWMQPATRDLTTGKLGLDKAKFLVREESRLGLLPHVPPRRACATACRRLGWRSWPPSVGRAVQDCGDAARAGWLARRAIVSGGGRPGWPDAWRCWHSGSRDFWHVADPGLAIAARPAARRAWATARHSHWGAAGCGQAGPGAVLVCGDVVRGGLYRQALSSGGGDR